MRRRVVNAIWANHGWFYIRRVQMPSGIGGWVVLDHAQRQIASGPKLKAVLRAAARHPKNPKQEES